MELITKCPKCGNKEYVIRFKGKKTGLYCRGCGKHIQWIPDKDMDDVYNQVRARVPKQHEKAVKIRKTTGNVMLVQCSNCGCPLYNSRIPVVGQFNLIDANYCPKCGKELL